MKKTISFLLASILTIMHSLAFASDKLSSRKCGEFELISESIEDYSTSACRIDDGIGDRGYKTPDAKTQIYVSRNEQSLIKNVGEAVDYVLLDIIRKKVKSKFQKKLSELNIQQEKSFYDAYIRMQNKILDDGKSAKSQVRKLLTLFPDLENEILQDNPEYKPLICRYEVWKHNRATIRKIAFTLTVIELAALLTAAPLAASVIFTASIDRALLVSQLLMTGGIAGIIGGALQIENNIATWDEVTAAKNAKMLLKFYNDIDNEIKKLQKEPDLNRQKILELQKWLPNHQEIEELKLTKKKQFKHYKDLFSGLTRVGLGITMVYGGKELFDMLSQFEAESATPASGSIEPPWMN
jgi:hypothetical protein